jgi:hypothetical protein
MVAEDDLERSFRQLEAKDFAAEELLGFAESGSASSVGDLNTFADEDKPTSLPSFFCSTPRT